jgi:site-specific DNA-cytosine methylase
MHVWTKSRRAMSDQDYETWIAGTVSPTLNAFDNATETRATVLTTTKQGTRRLTPLECERLQGFADNWTEGQADSHRYKQMGNAVTVNVARYLGTLIMGSIDGTVQQS